MRISRAAFLSMTFTQFPFSPLPFFFPSISPEFSLFMNLNKTMKEKTIKKELAHAGRISLDPWRQKPTEHGREASHGRDLIRP